MGLNSSGFNSWNMTYLGTSTIIPTMDYVHELLIKTNNLTAKLYKKIGDYYIEFRTDTINLPKPFKGKVYMSVAYLNGEVTRCRL